MYIQWQRRSVRRTGETTLRAVLVQSVRHQGQPRQRCVCYLGAIRVRYQQAPAHRQRFWARVDQRLAPLGLDPATRARLETALAWQVARPTPADLAHLEAQRTALSQLAATLGARHER